MYLSRALDEFHRAGNAPELWIEPDPFLKDSIVFGGAQQIVTAQNRRLQALRSCMLFAAIAVEAFANEFAYHVLGAQTAKTIDNLGLRRRSTRRCGLRPAMKTCLIEAATRSKPSSRW